MYQCYIKGWFEADTLSELAAKAAASLKETEYFCPMVEILCDEEGNDLNSLEFEAALLNSWHGPITAELSKASWKKEA